MEAVESGAAAHSMVDMSDCMLSVKEVVLCLRFMGTVCD